MTTQPDFAAIDFETANSHPASACAIGISAVTRGRIVTRSFLIRPPELKFSRRNIAIHGITPAMAAGEPTFAELYPQIRALLAAPDTWAHYAPFDQGVLNALAAHYKLPGLPRLQCTCRLSRRCFPGLRSHSLSVVCEHLGIPLKHHDPASDAEACARIVLAATARNSRPAPQQK